MYNQNVEIIPPGQPIIPVVPMMNGETAVTEGYRTAATTKGHVYGGISSQWMNRPDDQRFTSLYDLREQVAKWAQESRAEFIRPDKVRVTVDEGNQHFLGLDLGDGNVIEPNHWSFGQLCAMTKTPAWYLRTLPAKLAAINLQHGLMQNGGEDRMLAYVRRNGTQELRAVTSDSYGRIFDRDVIDQVINIAGDGIGQTRWKVPGTIQWGTGNGVTVKYNPFVDVTKENTTLYASDRDMYVFLVDDTHPIEIGTLPNGEPDLVFRGFVVWNSEVGSKTFGLQTMLMRGVCQNRNVWGAEGFKELNIRHTSGAPVRFGVEAGPALLSYSNASAMPIIEKVQRAKSTIVARDDEERVKFMTDKVKATKSVADRVIATVLREEQKAAESVWDFVQGMTAVARTIGRQDERLDLERTAGKLMERV